MGVKTIDTHRIDENNRGLKHIVDITTFNKKVLFKFMYFKHEKSANMENIRSLIQCLMLYSHETYSVAFHELSDFHGGAFV